MIMSVQHKGRVQDFNKELCEGGDVLIKSV